MVKLSRSKNLSHYIDFSQNNTINSHHMKTSMENSPFQEFNKNFYVLSLLLSRAINQLPVEIVNPVNEPIRILKPSVIFEADSKSESSDLQISFTLGSVAIILKEICSGRLLIINVPEVPTDNPCLKTYLAREINLAILLSKFGQIYQTERVSISIIHASPAGFYDHGSIYNILRKYAVNIEMIFPSNQNCIDMVFYNPSKDFMKIEEEGRQVLNGIFHFRSQLVLSDLASRAGIHVQINNCYAQILKSIISRLNSGHIPFFSNIMQNPIGLNLSRHYYTEA